MKKLSLMISIAISISVFMGTYVFAFAQDDFVDMNAIFTDPGVLQIVNDNLEELEGKGFTKERLSYMTVDEITNILNSETTFEGETESLNLVVGYVLQNNDDLMNTKTLNNTESSQVIAMIPITKSEYFLYEQNRNGFIQRNYPDLNSLKSKSNVSLYLFDAETESMELMSEEEKNNILRGPSVTQTIDSGVITLTTSYYKTTHTTKSIITLGLDWRWQYPNMPYWNLTDGVGLAHTGALAGLTNLEDVGGTHTYTTKLNPTSSDWITETLYPAVSVHGISTKYNQRFCHDTKGRIFVTISNLKTAVTQGYFYSVGGYAHQTLSIGSFGIGIAAGKVSFTPNFPTTNIIEVSPQPILNNIPTK